MWCHIERSRIRACPFLQVYQWSHSRHSSHPSVRECGGRGTHRTKPDNIPNGELSGERELDVVREAVHDFLDAWMLGGRGAQSNDGRLGRVYLGPISRWRQRTLPTLPNVWIPDRHPAQPLVILDGLPS